MIAAGFIAVSAYYYVSLALRIVRHGRPEFVSHAYASGTHVVVMLERPTMLMRDVVRTLRH